MWDPGTPGETTSPKNDTGNQAPSPRCYLCYKERESSSLDWRNTFKPKGVKPKGDTQPPYRSPLCARHKCLYPGCKQHRAWPQHANSWFCSQHKASSESPTVAASPPAVISPPVAIPQPVVIPKPAAAFQPVPQKPGRRCRLCYNSVNSGEDLNLCSRHRCTVAGCEAPRAKRHLPGNVRQSVYMGAKQRALSEDWLCSAHILLEALPDDGRANLSIGAKASPSETPSKAEVSRWDSGSFEEDPAPTKRHSRIRSMFKFVAKKKSDQHKCDLSMLEPVATTEEQVLHTNKSSTAAGVSKAAIPADQVPPHSPKETPGINTSKYKNDVESILTQIKHPLVPKFVIEDDMKRVGWHQCHAPACQARVISEDVWVCEKHLVQGHFDKDDPPGFMDRPGLGN